MNPQDPSNMRGMIENFPFQFASGSSWATHIAIPTDVSRIVVTGMGGSALPADLVNLVFAQHLRQPIILNRSYTIADSQLQPDTLVIACSFSGNTEETISAYSQAIASGTPTLVIAGGGELIRLAQTNGTPYVQLVKESPDFQPRMGSGYFFGAVAQVLLNIGWITATDLAQILERSEKLNPNALEPVGAELARFIGNHIPVFYTSEAYWPIGRIAKIKVNENSKTPAFWNYLPEANHNEMVGYTLPNGSYTLINLVDPTDDPRTNRRFDIMSQLLQSQKNIPHYTHEMVGETLFEKVFNTLIVADWTSYHLALTKNIDPTPVAMVEDFKQLVVK